MWSFLKRRIAVQDVRFGSLAECVFCQELTDGKLPAAVESTPLTSEPTPSASEPEAETVGNLLLSLGRNLKMPAWRLLPPNRRLEMRTHLLLPTEKKGDIKEFDCDLLYRASVGFSSVLGLYYRKLHIYASI